MTQYALHHKGVSGKVAIKGDKAAMMRRGPGALNLTNWVLEEIGTTMYGPSNLGSKLPERGVTTLCMTSEPGGNLS